MVKELYGIQAEIHLQVSFKEASNKAKANLLRQMVQPIQVISSIIDLRVKVYVFNQTSIPIKENLLTPKPVAKEL